MPQYQVNVALDAATLAALQNGFSMQAFKGAKASAPAGAQPTLWFQLDQFSSTVSVNWEEHFGGYFSNTPIHKDVVVNISTGKEMSLGQILTLQTDGECTLNSGGVSTAYNFASEQEQTWTCGLTVSANGQDASAICAFPQYGAVNNVIEPYEKVLLLFTQAQITTGAVVETAVSSSVSVILSPQNPTADLKFDINRGWDTEGNPYATENAADFAMATDLIIPIS
ncbi:MAG: hypothetical protein V3V74_07200 [Nitrosomonadaceae bacterium]